MSYEDALTDASDDGYEPPEADWDDPYGGYADRCDEDDNMAWPEDEAEYFVRQGEDGQYRVYVSLNGQGHMPVSEGFTTSASAEAWFFENHEGA